MRDLKVISSSVLALSILIPGLAVAQDTNFPLLHEGGARRAFVTGAYKSCFDGQAASEENGRLSPAILGASCLCYGRAMADAINGREYDALMTGTLLGSFTKKTEIARNICLQRISPAQQRSQQEKIAVQVKNECIKHYHPADTDAAAATVRDKFCGCYAANITASDNRRTANETVIYCNGQL